MHLDAVASAEVHDIAAGNRHSVLELLGFLSEPLLLLSFGFGLLTLFFFLTLTLTLFILTILLLTLLHCQPSQLLQDGQIGRTNFFVGAEGSGGYPSTTEQDIGIVLQRMHLSELIVAIFLLSLKVLFCTLAALCNRSFVLTTVLSSTIFLICSCS